MSVPINWRLIVDQPLDGATNMARDEAILHAVSSRKSLPTLRLYAWNPATVSIGYFQRAGSEVNLERLLQAGYGLVRRPTGGRAVLHDDELTYSVVISENDFPGTVVESYKRLSLGLVSGLRTLGIEAVLQAHAPGRLRSSAACFDAPSWYEVLCEGKKIIGSAQVRKHGTILQHGSIPITFSSENIARVLNVASDSARDRLARMLSQKAGGLADFMGRKPVFTEVADAITRGLGETLGMTFRRDAMSEFEIGLIQNGLYEKYAHDDWNLKK